MNDEPKMNYCCDCEYAVKKGLFLKTWYCTCPEVNFPYPVRDSVTGETALNFDEMIPTKVILLPGNPPLMPSFKTCEAARYFEQKKACPHFEEKPYAHPRKNPLPCPPLPERVEKATQEHDATYLMNQKQRELEEENKKLKEAKEELLKQLKLSCKTRHCYDTCKISGSGYTMVLTGECSIFKTIKKYDGKEGEK